MQTYALDQYPWYGWGQVFQKFFDKNAVTVDNTRSMGGRSSKSFIREGRLNWIVDRIKPGDYLFVQFGHNDAREQHDLKTSLGENGSYTKYLQIYVDLAEAKGANVVWLSSIPRATLQDTDLNGYPEEMIAYAEKNAITLVDVYHTALADFRQLEKDGIQAENLYLYLPKYEMDERYDADLLAASKFIADRKAASTPINDRTHINIYGADVVAQIAAKGLIEIGHPLARYVNESEFFDVAKNMPRPLYEG